MKYLNIILFTLTAMSGCAKKQERPFVYIAPPVTDTMPTLKATNTDSITYLALGDSYTIGEAEPQDQSFPYQLSASLKKIGFKIGNPPIIATTGWTTQNLIDAIATHDPLQPNYDFVTLLIGVNDQFQGLSQTLYRSNFVKLLSTAIYYAKGDKTRVFVLSIPDYGVTPFAGGQDAIIGPEIDAFNAINLEESKNAGVNYLDITPISRQAANNPNLIAPDGLHPSGTMYGEWVKDLMPVVTARLNKN